MKNIYTVLNKLSKGSLLASSIIPDMLNIS